MIKFYETHYDDYIVSNEKVSLQPKIMNIINNILPNDFNDFKNIIFYGLSGSGKYTCALSLVKKYSLSNLKYEKKINIQFSKQEYCFKISDIHYEIDMSLLGCNSKLLWHEIYSQIVDIISLKTDKKGIIMCKNFNEIQIELLDNFYSYMQSNIYSNVNIKFLLITESISFIPENIIKCSNIINFSRPTKKLYTLIYNNNIIHNSANNSLHNSVNLLNNSNNSNNSDNSDNSDVKNECLKKTDIKKEHSLLGQKTEDFLSQDNLKKINNIKNLFCSIENPIKHYQYISNKIVNEYICNNSKKINFLKLRELIYDIFVYNLNVNEIIFNILFLLTEKYDFDNIQFTEILTKTYKFLKYYNNNYRPIYHAELYIYHLINIIKTKYKNGL
jgi:adenylate kinase family enzyme